MPDRAAARSLWATDAAGLLLHLKLKTMPGLSVQMRSVTIPALKLSILRFCKGVQPGAGLTFGLTFCGAAAHRVVRIEVRSIVECMMIKEVVSRRMFIEIFWCCLLEDMCAGL